MQRKLVIKAFEKAKEETESKKLTHQSKYLSDFIFNDSGEQYGEKSLRDKFNEIKKNKEIKIELKGYVKEALSRFLDYPTYEAFKKENPLSDNPALDIGNVNKIKQFILKNKIILSICIAIIMCTLIIISVTKQRWMIWEVDQYIEVNFDTEKYNIDQLKLYKKDRIDNFKKIIPDCNTEFFKSDNSVNLWYGKNKLGDLEYFTSLGLHPETGKTLKPITKYMISKYICVD